MILILGNVYQTASVSIQPDNLTTLFHDFFNVVAFEQQADRTECMGMITILRTSCLVEVEQFDTEQLLPFQQRDFSYWLITLIDLFLLEEYYHSVTINLVPVAGVEPARGFPRHILSVVRATNFATPALMART